MPLYPALDPKRKVKKGATAIKRKQREQCSVKKIRERVTSFADKVL